MNRYVITIDPEHIDAREYLNQLDSEAKLVNIIEANTQDGIEIWEIVTAKDLDAQLLQNPHIISGEVHGVDVPQYAKYLY